MAFEIDARMAPELLGLAWMVGHWEGTGHGEIDGETREFAVAVDFTENGAAYLHYIMQWFATDDAGSPTRCLGVETGFWRPKADGQVEVVIAHPEGVAEVYIGQISGARIEIRTDLVARTTTADVPVTGGHRLYGNVESDLMFAYDRGTADQDLRPYVWARLARA